MKKSHGKELHGKISVRKKNEPLTAALDTMGFKIATMASQHPDREVAVQLFAVACKITAISKHLKSDSSSESEADKDTGRDRNGQLRLIVP